MTIKKTGIRVNGKSFASYLTSSGDQHLLCARAGDN